MKKEILVLLMLILAVTAKGQMNFQDSSVQVVSYWDLGEQYEYAVTFQELKYEGEDTTLNQIMKYDAEVSVIDSTESSYTVRWLYKNFETNSSDTIVQKMVAISENIAVDIRLNELGMVQYIENWEEVRDYMFNCIDSLKHDFDGIAGMDQVMKQLKNMYGTKEVIEATAIKDVLQFHHFHGAKYELGERYTAQLKSPNLYDNEKPFDTDIWVELEDLNQEDNQYIIRSIQEVDPDQLADAAYQYLKETKMHLGQEPIDRAYFEGIKTTIETVSLFHNTGWVLESIQWKEVISEGVTQMEIRTVLLK